MLSAARLQRASARQLVRSARICRPFSAATGSNSNTGNDQLFDTILIANRGEIACRVQDTCRRLGVKTVAVFSDADANAQHTLRADEAIRVGPAAAAESYLVQDAILDAARRTGAQGVHPGYGFLSENAGFAERCEKEGIAFIGPPSSAITDMGSKSASKRIMLNAGVPCTPGYHGEDQTLETLTKEAHNTGFPVMLKAVMGGGGKGMRVVTSPDDIESNLEACQREALASFGDGRILIERYLPRPRHIEVQVFADKFGNVVHLFERDCSVQRRHQKVLEEAPAPGMPEKLRERLGKAAVDAARAVGYVGAGTVEFMMDGGEPLTDDAEFFFMEMNTRLQVEHPVSELVSGVDLVEWQLKVASGQPLPKTQDELKLRGHALEARVYAESPENGFLPGSGTISHLHQPATYGADGLTSTHNIHDADKIGTMVRVDTGVIQGDTVSIFYDPMISKLIVHAQDRATALRVMDQALAQYQVVGLPTNIEFLRSCVRHPAFAEGGVDTSFIAEHEAELLPKGESPEVQNVTEGEATALALGLLAQRLGVMEDSKVSAAARGPTPLAPWSDAGSGVPFEFGRIGSEAVTVQRQSGTELSDVGVIVETLTTREASPRPNGEIGVKVTVDTYDRENVVLSGVLESRTATSMNVRALVDGMRSVRATCVVRDLPKGRAIDVFPLGAWPKRSYRFYVPVVAFDGLASAGGAALTAPMPGKVIKVNVKEGDVVKQGDALVVMEAMKMEHVLKAPRDGVVAKLTANVGDFVDDSALLCTVGADDEEE